AQFIFIPTPSITEKNCPDQTGRVFIVTGGYSGIDSELCKILYQHNATVYVAGRSQTIAERAISSFKQAAPKALAGLSVETFLEKEKRLDIVVNNAAPHGMEIDDNGKPKDTDVLSRYGQSKAGNVFLAREYSRATPETGVVHACFNPGNLKSELQRHWGEMFIVVLKKLLFWPAVYGAYTELWAALAPELTLERSCSYLYPWGRFGSLPEGIETS
ncbi:hypothetical protein LSUE1_G008335, partial [Lachnellula suecica]